MLGNYAEPRNMVFHAEQTAADRWPNKMKEQPMSRTIQAIAAHMIPVKRPAPATRARQLTVDWQDGFESGGQIQRKLRFTLSNSAAFRPAN